MDGNNKNEIKQRDKEKNIKDYSDRWQRRKMDKNIKQKGKRWKLFFQNNNNVTWNADKRGKIKMLIKNLL